MIEPHEIYAAPLREEEQRMAAAGSAAPAAPRPTTTVSPAGALASSTDLLLRVVAKNPDDLYRVSEEIRLCPGINRTSTSLFLRQVIP